MAEQRARLRLTRAGRRSTKTLLVPSLEPLHVGHFRFGHCAWRLGELTLVTGSRGVRRVYFGRRSESDVRRDLDTCAMEKASEPSPVESTRNASPSTLLELALAELEEYLAGRRRGFSVPVDLGGQTPFRRRVLTRSRGVPFGATITYGQLAREVQSPGAARAVGGAMGHNPVPIFVPCHRVVASGGKIGGFTGGLAIKRSLLELEGISPASD